MHRRQQRCDAVRSRVVEASTKRLLASGTVLLVAFACTEQPTLPDVSPPAKIPDVLVSVTATQLAKLTAADAAAGDRFGTVAVSGDVAVVGAILGNDQSGSAYVFRHAGGMWTQQAKLTAIDAAAGDWFGATVTVSGDVAAVGAPFDLHAGVPSGSAYVFRHASGVWTQEAKLVSSDAANFDWFGSTVAVDGDMAVVGAPQDDDSGDDSGSAYVFRRESGMWTEEAKLVASDAATGAQFGWSVAVSGDVAVIGAYNDNNSGAAYVFRHASGVWTQEAKLVASDAVAFDWFGWSVAVSGDVAVVGAYLDDDAAGSAYAFQHAGGVWTEEAKLVASDAAVNDRFGWSVAVSGEVAVVGAVNDDDAGNASGSAYVFQHANGLWMEEAKLVASDGAPFDVFGGSVAVDGEVAVIGASGDDDAGDMSGSAYVFELSLEPDDPETVIEDVIEELGTLADGADNTLAEELEDAISRLETALNALGETPPDLVVVMQALEQAVDLLEALVSDGLLDPVQGEALMDQLAGVARGLAVTAIDEAIAGDGDPEKIAEAEAELAEGDTLRAAGEFTAAVDKYKDALVKAESA